MSQGHTLAIVGESGSGKSVTAQAIMGLLNRGYADITGRIVFDGTDLLALDDDEVRRMRGASMAMIFQDPLSSLHPFYRIPSPDKRANDYPHQLSGGLRQRVLIAMALINSPSLLIADEPTTALDVTVQAQITELMSELQRETGTTLIIITHDLGVVADMADEVCVMYGGRVVEYAPVRDIYYSPQHPYTQGLLASVPRLATDRVDRLDPIPGNPPSLINLPSGCVFHPRCGQREDVPGDLCRQAEPMLVDAGRDHLVRCYLADQAGAR